MRWRLGFGIVSCIAAGSAWGSNFVLNPWILIFEPQNKVISQMVTYTFQGGPRDQKGMGPQPDNNENTPVPVEISISAREVTPDGSVIYPSSQGADDFVVYPSQFILYPGDSKRIQVQWVGSAIPGKETSFGFISTQLPLDIKSPKETPKTAVGIVQVSTRYEGIIVVRPSGVKPDVIVDTAYSRRDSAGTSLVVVLNNKGTGMQPLKSMSLFVSPIDPAGKVRFDQKVLIKEIKPSKASNQSLLAGFKRMVSVPWPTDLPVGPVRVAAVFTDAPK